MTRSSTAVALAVATSALLGMPLAAEAFCNPPSRWSTPAHLALSAITSSDADGGGDVTLMAEGAPEAAAIPSAPGNPFLPLLSKGLRQASVAMNKSTSDEVFGATPSLQRMRKQVQQLTKVGPSSLGEHAGLGLFATKKNIKAGTVVGLYPAHALGYELFVPMTDGGEIDEDNLQDLSMFLAQNEEDEAYFAEHPHGNSPYLHATDQPLFQRPSLLSPLFDEGKDEMSPPLYLDVNPSRNEELDGIWTSHYINDGASLLDMQKGGATPIDEAMEQYYVRSTQEKNCIHIPFGPSPILATVTTKKVKKEQELFTSYGVVYWLGAVDTPEGEDGAKATERIKEQIVESARDLQKALEGANTAYAAEMADLEKALGNL